MNKSKLREQEYGDYSKNLAIELPAEAVEVLSNGKNAYIHMNGIVYRVIEEKKYWEALSQNRKAILEEVRSENMKGFARDKIFKKYKIDMHNTKQYEAFLDGWNEKAQTIFQKLSLLQGKES